MCEASCPSPSEWQAQRAPGVLERDNSGPYRAVLEVIKMGYVLPLKENPPQFCRQNQASARAHAEFVQQSIVDLMASGCIREVPTLQWGHVLGVILLEHSYSYTVKPVPHKSLLL